MSDRTCIRSVPCCTAWSPDAHRFQAANPIDTLRLVLDQPPVEPRNLNPSVDRDLETICLKCLEKEPTRRYATASELTAELQRYIDGQPILARPVSRLEHAWRWCKRRPLEAALINLAALSLVAGTAFSSYYAVLASKRAELAERRKQVAVATLEKNIKSFQHKLKNIPAAREVRREILRDSVAGLEMISDELRSEERIDRNTAVSLAELGRLFVEIGDEEGLNANVAAEQNYVDAAKIYAGIVKPDETDLELLRDQAWTLCELGNFYLNRGQYGAATPKLSHALKLRRRIWNDNRNDPDATFQLCFSLCDWGDLLAEQSRFQDSIEFYREANEINEKALGPGSNESATDQPARARISSTG